MSSNWNSWKDAVDGNSRAAFESVLRRDMRAALRPAPAGLSARIMASIAAAPTRGFGDEPEATFAGGSRISEAVAAFGAFVAAALILLYASLATRPAIAPQALLESGSVAFIAELAGAERLDALIDDSARALGEEIEMPLFGELNALALDAGRVADALLASLVDPLANATRPVWESATRERTDGK